MHAFEQTIELFDSDKRFITMMWYKGVIIYCRMDRLHTVTKELKKQRRKEAYGELQRVKKIESI